MPVALHPLPSVHDQASRLVALGVHELAGLPARDLLNLVELLDQKDSPGSLLALHPDLVPASALVPLLTWQGREAFLVVDLADVDEFTPIEAAAPPPGPVHLLHGLDRGDEMANWSPAEALPALLGAGRTPLTLTEGIHWLLQQPDVLERGRCFMTIGSRLRKPSGRLDARTPALWISNGTGRDGRERRNAPKVGWCWEGNRHTWLGFASAAGRS